MCNGAYGITCAILIDYDAMDFVTRYHKHAHIINDLSTFPQKSCRVGLASPKRFNWVKFHRVDQRLTSMSESTKRVQTTGFPQEVSASDNRNDNRFGRGYTFNTAPALAVEHEMALPLHSGSYVASTIRP